MKFDANRDIYLAAKMNECGTVRFNGGTVDISNCSDPILIDLDEVKKEVWLFALKVIEMEPIERHNCFDTMMPAMVIRNDSYDVAKQKYEKYLGTKDIPKDLTVEQVSEMLGYKVRIVAEE